MIYFHSAYDNEQSKLTQFNFPVHESINKNIYEENKMALNKTIMNKTKNTEESKNKPMIKYQCGQVSLTVWDNNKEENDNSFLSFNIKKSYYDDAKKVWNETQSMNVNDLQNIIAICQKAISELRIKVSE
jgi:membrane-bound inhibitor of C-type lysozyme